MDWIIFARDYAMAFGQALIVRFPLESRWDSIMEFFGNDEYWILTAGTCLSLIGSFLLVNIFYISLDVTGKPRFFMKYKIQKDKNMPVNVSRYINCVKVALFNKVMTCAAVFLLFPVMSWRGMGWERPLPSIPKFILDYFICIVFNEFIFYYGHRAMHLPMLYKHIHKMHHEWIAPVSWAAIYNHPIDHIVAHILPLLAPPIILGSHMLTTWVWLIIFQIEAAMHHSNYHFPFFSSPQFHDYHHLKFTENYGSLGWLDSFHKTNLTYVKSIQSKRSIMFFDSVPVCQKFPSKNPKEQ